jgi:hypothetical protein
VREGLGCDLLVPAVIGASDARPPQAPWRRRMFDRFKQKRTRKQYGQRWQVETAFSMIKRNYGSALRACTPPPRTRTAADGHAP